MSVHNGFEVYLMTILTLKKSVFFRCSNSINNIKYYLILFLILSVFIIPSNVFAETKLSRESGGTGGAPFVEMVAPGGVISSITIRSGSLIDSIQLTYRYKHQVPSRIYGGGGGTARSFNLQQGEYITEFSGRSGRFVDSIYIKTNRGRTKRWGGHGGERSFKFTGTRSSPIQGIWGRSGVYIDAIGVINKSRSVPRSSNSQGCTAQTNLNVFKPNPNKAVGNGGGENCDKCENMTTPIFPALSSNHRDLAFWKNQNKRLYRIVRSLAESQNELTEFKSYIDETEYKHCKGHVYCEIDTRADLIVNIMGIR